MRIEDSEILQNWNYLSNKEVGKKGKRLSDDGAYVLAKNGKRVARNICISPINQGIGLFWHGWLTQLERVQSIYDRLSVRLDNLWENEIQPIMLRFLGEENEAIVYAKDSRARGKKEIFGYHIRKNFDMMLLRRALPKNHPLRTRKFSLSFSREHLSDTAKLLHPSQLPIPSEGGQKLCRLMEYQESLQRRKEIAKRVFDIGIALRLEEIAEDYATGDLVRFKIGNKTHIFQRTNQYKSWAQAGEQTDLDFNSLTPATPHWSQNWKYERYKRCK